VLRWLNEPTISKDALVEQLTVFVWGATSATAAARGVVLDPTSVSHCQRNTGLTDARFERPARYFALGSPASSRSDHRRTFSVSAPED